MSRVIAKGFYARPKTASFTTRWSMRPPIAIELAECPGQAEEQRQALAEARQAEGFET